MAEADPPADRERLCEQRDFLLASLDDLDAEYAAGDLDKRDYDELRDGYVGRAAEVLRALAVLDAAGEADADPPATNRRRGWVWLAGAAAFVAVAAGLLVASLADRGQGTLTGGDAPGSELDRCRQLMGKGVDAEVSCFDEVLASRPDDVEAITYQGWALARGGKPKAAAQRYERAIGLDATYPDVYAFRAILAKNERRFNDAQADLDRLDELGAPEGIQSTIDQMGLRTELAEARLTTASKDCWADLKPALDAVNTVVSQESDREQARDAVGKLVAALDCTDRAIAADPTDADALIMRGLGLGVLDEASVRAGVASLDQALAVRPDDPSALLLRSALHARLGDNDLAVADLDALKDRRVSPLFDVVDRVEIRKSVTAGS